MIFKIRGRWQTGTLQVLSVDRVSMLATWELFTPDNLSQVPVKNGDGLTVETSLLP